MHRSKHVAPLSLLAALTVPPPASAQWSEVAPGIDYAEMTASGPNQVFVTRMRRDDPGVTLDSAVAMGSLRSGRETVSGMAARYDETMSFWGEHWGDREEVVAAINGSFFDLDTGVPFGGVVEGGWYAKRWDEFTPGGFVWNLDREALIDDCVRHRRDENFLEYPDGTMRAIRGINTGGTGDELVLYTHHYDTRTPESDAFEVVVELDTPSMLIPEPAGTRGTVLAVAGTGGGTPIFFDQLVLSGTGSVADELPAGLSPGDTIEIAQELTSLREGCSSAAPFDRTRSYASISGSFHFLRDGVVQSFTDPGATSRHPRTAIAFDAVYVYFVVVDGRSASSAGMSMTELGAFCRDRLSATEGINQDGGGSSALWVRGDVANHPSDGVERAVANGMLMIRLHPMERSYAFGAGDVVRVSRAVQLRVGPGANFGVHDAMDAGAEGRVLPHPVAGVLATEDRWWPCDFGSGTGWVEERDLELVRRAEREDAGAGGAPDGNPAPPYDAASETPEHGWAATMEGGCACRVATPSRDGAAGPAVVGLLFALAFSARCRRRRRRRPHRGCAAVALVLSVGGCAAGAGSAPCASSADCAHGSCVDGRCISSRDSGDAGATDSAPRTDARPPVVAVDAAQRDGPFECGDQTFVVSETQESVVVPNGVRYMQIKAWGAGGNDERQCGEVPDGGPGGYTEAVFEVIPGTELVVIVGKRGRSGLSGEDIVRFGFGAWGGGGLSGVFRGPGPIDARGCDRALVVAGGGGSANAPGCSPGGPGNHPTAGGAPTMQGEAPPGSPVGGGGGCNGGIAGGDVGAKGGTGYVGPEALERRTRMLYAEPASNAPPNRGDSDYDGSAGRSELSGQVVIHYLCEPPPPLS